MLKFETLERKDLLAGDVAVFVDGTTLHIQGDNEGNSLFISELGVGGGLIFQPGAGTVNGEPSQVVFLLPQDIDHIMMDMGAGSDNIFFSGISELTLTLYDVTIDLGHGSGNGLFDSVILQGSFPGDVTIIGGDQEELVRVDAQVHGNLDIRTGSGSDLVEVGAIVFGTTYIDVAQNGLTADQIELSYATFHGNVTLLAGQGNDSVSVNNCTFYADIGIYGEQGRHDELIFENNTLFGELFMEGFEIV